MYKRLFLLFIIVSSSFYNVKSEEAFYPESTFFIQDDQFFLHTIERGQTVYSISIMYNVTVEAIHRLNPESRNVIRIGDVLRIPQESGSYIYHTIQPRETLFGLAQRYYMKGEDIIAVNPGLSVETFSAGRIVRIPTNLVTSPVQGRNEAQISSQTNALLSQIQFPVRVNTIKVALLLPFGIGESRRSSNFLSQARIVEYYEGFLLALLEMKKNGIVVDLIVRDTGTGTREIPAILQQSEIQDIHLLIGGVSEEQIRLLSRFSKEKNIPYVIPLTQQSDETLTNPLIYQVITPPSNMHSKASLAFVDRYSRDNIILVSDETGASNRKDFTDLLKQDLQERRIPYKTIAFGANFLDEIQVLLSSNQRNVVVPSDDSDETLSKLTAPLKSIIESNPRLSLSLFGYPVWQRHSSTTRQHSDDFFRLNVTFYAAFYSNPTSPEVRAFHGSFYRYFTKQLENSVPKYGMFGYDTGMYFIRLIHTYGTPFDSLVNNLKYNGLQTDFYFERLNNWSGFINTNMYLVTYSSDYSITKTPIR